MKKLLVLCMSLMAVLPSCRRLVQEDRMACPSYLFFEVEDGPSLDSHQRVLVTAQHYPDGESLCCDTTLVKALEDQSFSLAVRRCESVSGYGVTGFSRSHVKRGSQWVVDEGQNGDPLCHFSYLTEALEERSTVPVRLYKSYSRITVRFLSYDAYPLAGGRFPFQLVVSSHTCGIDVSDGSPVQGPFLYHPEEITAGVFSFIVPRQADHSLRMELWAKPGLYEKEGYIDEYLLWPLLAQVKGFSWEKEDLPDFLLEIDYVQSCFTLFVYDWAGDASIQYEL